MSRLFLYVLWFFLSGLSFANPTEDSLEWEEDVGDGDDYEDYEQGIIDHRGASEPCVGVIELMTSSRRTARFDKVFEYSIKCILIISFRIDRSFNFRRRPFIMYIRVTGNCCWELTTSGSGSRTFCGGAESAINNRVIRGRKSDYY